MSHPKKLTKQYPVALTDEQVKTLRESALSLGYTYGGRGSISLLIQAWADYLAGRVA